MKKHITHDLYDIASRIKAVDRDYEIYFDSQKSTFVLYCGGKFCLVLGASLNKCALDKAYSSHVRNAYRITREIEKDNQRLEEKEQFDLLSKSRMTLHSYIEYADGKGDTSFDGAGTTKWL